MADLDLAVGQEEWNDFADETTAPPRSPTPPPSPSPPQPLPSALYVVSDAPAVAAGDEPAEIAGIPSANDGATVAARASETEGVGDAEPTRPDPFIYSGRESNSAVLATAGQPQPRSRVGEDWSFSAGAEVGVEATAIAAAVSGGGTEGGNAAVIAAVTAESEDDWGDFEEAGVGRGQPPSDQSRDGKTTEERQEGNDISLPESENSEDGWGGFSDAPVAATVGAGVGDREVGASPEFALAEDPTATTGGASSGDNTGAPELLEVEDPFAAIAPRTPPSWKQPVYDDGGLGETSSPVVGDDAEGAGTEAAQMPAQRFGESLVGTTGGGAGGPEERAAAAAASAVAGLPLSLRDLRDALTTRGRLEEAVEVQRRMELPATSITHLATTPVRGEAGGVGLGVGLGTGAAGVGYMGEAPNVSDVKDAAGGDGSVDGDLERWRAATKFPPAPTLEQLAEVVSEADAARGEKFRERFVSGRPAVEEEALAGGGAVSLGRAVKRQRAARRAVSLSAALGASAAETEGVEVELEGADGVIHGVLDIDIGVGATGGRPPPCLPDWVSMVAYVARMAEKGFDALKEGGSVAGAGTGSAKAETETPGMGAGLEGFGGGDGSDFGDTGLGGTGLFGGAAGSLSPPPTTAPSGQGSGEDAPANGDVVREVALSSRFIAFSQGLREAVRVCRMLQASAEDGLETVDGFAAMERAWAEFRRRARQAVRRPSNAAGDGSGSSGVGGGSGGGVGGVDAGEYPAVFGPEDGDDDNEEEEKRSLEEPVHSSFLSGRGKTGEEGGNGGGGDSGGSGSGSARASDGGVLVGSVKAVREAGIERAPAGSALCAVCLQPLEVFGGGRSAPDVVEYCGVRYLATAVNLWVNVLDKPPPGPLPLDGHA